MSRLRVHLVGGGVIESKADSDFSPDQDTKDTLVRIVTEGPNWQTNLVTESGSWCIVPGAQVSYIEVVP